jgi:Holliday junction resolvasome RuvABC endonuclease subunit
MRIMGIDPSIASTGLSFPSAETVAVKPKTKGDFRLTEIGDHVQAAATIHRIDLVVIEGLGGIYPGKSARIIPMLHGVLRDRLQILGIPFMILLPGSLKKFATGDGGADKDEMAKAAFRRLGRRYSTDDECDADWLRVAGRMAYGLGELTDYPGTTNDWLRVPADQLKALRENVKGQEIVWPVVGIHRPWPKIAIR